MNGRSAPIPRLRDAAPGIADHILTTARAIRRLLPDAALITAWDFDGTMLHGDCSEGLTVDRLRVYAGLIETAIQEGFSRRFRPGAGVPEFWQQYSWEASERGRGGAYGFAVQAFAGANAEQLSAFAREYFASTLRPWLVAESVELVRHLESEGIRCHVISASADHFVKSAAAEIGLPVEQIHGIRLRKDADGTLTDEVLEPFTYAEGKVAQLRMLLAASNGFPVAAFGNSHDTDGAMLAEVARTSLPAGSPLSIMINGGDSPAEFAGLFHEVAFSGSDFAAALTR